MPFKILNPHPKQHLTADELLSLLDIDFSSGRITWKRRGAEMFSSRRGHSMWNSKFSGKPALDSTQGDGYKCGTLLNAPVLAHRVIYAAYHGYWPEFVDHINGNRQDNRIENLREATRTENGQNARKPTGNTSGHIGVSWNRRDSRWTAYITVNQKRKALGNFTSIEDAVQCRKKAEADFGFHANHGR